MFKKKPVYVILLVVFSLVLCADMATYLAFPGMESRTRMPGNFSTESMENFDGEAVRPEDFSSEIPSGDRQQDNGDEQGQDIPSENDAGAQNADDGAPTSTENFNSQDFSEESPFGGEIASPANGFLRFVKSAFLPILIVCLLADAFCVLMLIHLRKKHGKDDSPKSSDSIAPRKRSKKLWIVLLAMMPVIATALAVLPNQSANEGGGAISAEELVVSATVETGEIVSSFYGSGTLNDEEAAAATILSSVEVVSYAVKNGDTVSEGDPIAVIDRISAQNAIAELQDAMDALDEEIAQASADRISDTVQAPSAGRVKRIFAQENAGVADTMYEHGALILISLDGCMAVDVESEDACTVGQSVAVILSDGREEAGKVAEVGNGVVTVTLTDNGPEYGENVSVTDSDGKTIGSGELYIHSELKITGFSGTISNIHVSEESTVSEGKTLLTLADTEYVGAYHQLLEERETLLEEMKKLTVMYQDGYVYAECDGIISGIDSGAVGTELSSEEKGSSTLFSASYADETGGGTLLSKSRTDANNVALLRTGISLSGASSIRGLSNADALYAEPVASDSPESSEVSQSSNVQYAGKVTSVSYGTMQFRRTADPVGDLGYADLAGYDAGLFTIEAEYSPDLAVAVYKFDDDGSRHADSVENIKEGDLLLLSVDEDNSLVRIDYIASKSVPQETLQSPEKGDAASSRFSSIGNAETEDAKERYSLSLETLCFITPNDTITVDIRVDELDVLSLAEGQQATVTLDAISGKRFEGEITSINPTGINDGGSTKYTVTLKLVRTEDMLGGMNASVQITTKDTDDVLTVPAAALYEEGNQVFVYTDYDEKTDTLRSPVEVATGVSDGTNVEITEGLETGNVVYYRYADALVYASGGNP